MAAACEQPSFRPGDCVDTTAAIFSNVREHICSGRLRLSPADRAEGVDGNSDAYNTRILGFVSARTIKGRSSLPVSLHRAGRVGRLEPATQIIKFAGAILVVLATTVLME